MAESQQKRLREESHNESETLEFDNSNPNNSPKRQKPYNNILSLLEEEEDQEPNQDLSDIFTSLQQELSSSATFDLDPPPSAHHTTISGDVEDDVKSVMRHLLEASDDELGIPCTAEEYNGAVEVSSDAENFPFAFVDNGLWELEDVAANYYTMLQSELFM